jgi:hypothetical protein
MLLLVSEDEEELLLREKLLLMVLSPACTLASTWCLKRMKGLFDDGDSSPGMLDVVLL